AESRDAVRVDPAQIGEDQNVCHDLRVGLWNLELRENLLAEPPQGFLADQGVLQDRPPLRHKNEPFSYKLALQTRVLATSPPGKSSPSGNVYPVRDNCPSKETPRRDPCALEGHLARLPSVRHLDHVRGRPARGTGHIGSCDLGPVLGGRRLPRCLASSGPASGGRDVPATSHRRSAYPP